MPGTIPVPTIHLNGTSREALLEQATKVCDAMRKAIDTMHDAAPNARDYYVQGTGAYRAAHSAHSFRVQRAAELLHEYEDLAEAIADTASKPGEHRK